MYNKITVTETTEEAKKNTKKSKGKNLTPTAIFCHYSVIILALFFDGEEARRNRSPWLFPGKVLPPKREDQREMAKRPQTTAPGKSSPDWKRYVSHSRRDQMAYKCRITEIDDESEFHICANNV